MPAVSVPYARHVQMEGIDRLVEREAVVPANWGRGFSAMIGGDEKARETTRSAGAGLQCVLPPSVHGAADKWTL
jgi:hypothetical protein